MRILKQVERKIETERAPGFEGAKRAYLSQDFHTAKALLDSVIRGPSSPGDQNGARYLRGRGFEDGFFVGGVNLEKAIEDYSWLKEEQIARGVIGYARILLFKAPAENANEVISLLTEPVAKERDPKAMMLLGMANELGFSDFHSARKWYLRAYLHGLPCGLDFYANLQAKEGNLRRAVVAKVLANVTRPLLEAIHGKRTPFN